MLFLQSLHIHDQFQRLLVVAIADAGVHQLRDFKNLQDLCVTIQSQTVHSPTDADLFRFLRKTSV